MSDCGLSDSVTEGNQTGHYALHAAAAYHAAMILSATRMVCVGVTTALLTVFLFTLNWWVFAAVVVCAVADVMVSFGVKSTQDDAEDIMAMVVIMTDIDTLTLVSMKSEKEERIENV